MTTFQYDFRTVPPKSMELLKEWANKNILTPNDFNFGAEIHTAFDYRGKLTEGLLVFEGNYDSRDIIFEPTLLPFFFDEQRIYGIVNVVESSADELDFGIELTRNPKWYWEIHGVTYEYAFSDIDISKREYPTPRSQALTALYDKSFSILEQRLTQGETI